MVEDANMDPAPPQRLQLQLQLRRLTLDDPLFEDCNFEREEVSQAQSVQVFAVASVLCPSLGRFLGSIRLDLSCVLSSMLRSMLSRLTAQEASKGGPKPPSQINAE